MRIAAQDRNHLRVDLRIRGDDLAPVQEIGVARVVAHEAARLGDEQATRRDVPHVDALFEEAVEAARRDVREIERRRARAAQPGARLRHLGEEARVGVEAVFFAERKARADQRVREAVAPADADAPVVQVGAAAARRGEEVVVVRIVDHRLRDDALVRKRDRHAVVRKAVNEVRRAVERIDDPLEFGCVARFAGFFGEDRMIGISGLQRFDDRVFRRLVDFRHEIVLLLLADLDQIEVERCAIDDLSGAASRLDSDVEHGMHEPES